MTINFDKKYTIPIKRDSCWYQRVPNDKLLNRCGGAITYSNVSSTVAFAAETGTGGKYIVYSMFADPVKPRIS